MSVSHRSLLRLSFQVQCDRASTNIIIWYLATLGLAIEVLGMLIPWSLHWVKTIDPLVARTYFWWFGHPRIAALSAILTELISTDGGPNSDNCGDHPTLVSQTDINWSARQLFILHVRTSRDSAIRHFVREASILTSKAAAMARRPLAFSEHLQPAFRAKMYALRL